MRQIFHWTCLTLAAVVLSASGIASGGDARGVESPGPTASFAQRVQQLKDLIQQGRHSDAERGARLLLDGAEKSQSPEPREVAQALDVLATALLRGGHSGESETLALAEKSLALRESFTPPDAVELAQGLATLAMLRLMRGELDEAEVLYKRALPMREKELGKEHVDVGKILNNLGIIATRREKLEEARDLYARAAGVFEKGLGAESPLFLTVLNNVADLDAQLGFYPEAEKTYSRVLDSRIRALGPDHPDVAATLNNLGLLRTTTHDYVAARDNLERALSIKEARLGKEHPDLSSTLANLALLLREIGDYPTALELAQRAVSIAQRKNGSESEEAAAALANLASAFHEAGDWDRARSLEEQALEIRTKILGPRHSEVGKSLANLGMQLSEAGDLPSARLHLEQALDILKSSLGPKHPFTATVLTNLADTCVRSGDYESAERLYQEALAVRQASLGPEDRTVALTWVRLAELYLITDRRDLAVDAAVRGEAIARKGLRTMALALSEREALRYEEAHSSGLDVLLTSLTSAGDAPAKLLIQSWDSLVRSRALVLEAMMLRHHVSLESREAPRAAATDRFIASTNRLAALAARGPDPRNPEVFLAKMEEARRDRESAERALGDAGRAISALTAGKVGLTEVIEALPAKSALVAYFRYLRIEPKDPQALPGRTLARQVPSYLAFVARAGEEAITAIPLGPAESLDTLVKQWRELVGKPPSQLEISDDSLEGKLAQAGTLLRRRVWDPIEKALHGSEMVFVVPDGSLNLVNLAALPGRRKGYLMESGPLLHYLSAERDLPGYSSRRRPGGRVLLLGSPDFDGTPSANPIAGPVAADLSQSAGSREPAVKTGYRTPAPGCAGLQSLRFSPIPETAEEIAELEQLWSGAGDKAAGPGERVITLTGASASEENFKSLAPGAGIIHVATHGFFAGSDCPSVFSSFWSTRESEKDPEESIVSHESPLLLTGLVFAGANRRQDPSHAVAAEDGMLTSAEIASLDMSSARLVVLSACETGLGKLVDREGVLGLRRAFQVAGAQNLVMTLWPVEDEATREWISHFYAFYLKGRSAARSSREASLEILRSRRANGRSTHPFYWGAFVDAGGWR